MRLDVEITARVTGHEEILRHEGNSIVAAPGSVIVEFEGAQFPMNRRAFEAVCPDLIYEPMNQAYREPTEIERAAAEPQPLDEEGNLIPTPEPAEGDPDPAATPGTTGPPDVEQYATGGGWYEIPGLGKKVRKDEAIAALAAEE